jgi:hypothetical protein
MTDPVPSKERVEMSPEEQLWRALQNLGGAHWSHGNTAAKAIDALIKKRIDEALSARAAQPPTPAPPAILTENETVALRQILNSAELNGWDYFREFGWAGALLHGLLKRSGQPTQDGWDANGSPV